ncbi:DUF29 domain-containing protein [Chromatium okenii]|uniref:DUF29 domain-containing protein n=1 Tax=Chromatium okenii TaxID=61644 RepID=UPI0026EB008D|nr:DUF29 domain-containing protein [Chromatium okenii]MBV5310998.1 DUF29 domain-containing protein [Chromatium okenii]
MATIDARDDHRAWLLESAALIRAGQFDALDAVQLAEELEDIGTSTARELENRVGVLLAHLLKWRYQPERRGASWEATIKEQRQRILRLLRKNPSLKENLEETCTDAYSDARLIARRETGLPENTFPQLSPFDWQQTVGDFWPEEHT